MSKEKRRWIYIAAWTVLLIVLLILSLVSFGYEDPNDVTLAIMFFVVPILVMIADMANFFRFEKYYTVFRFVAANFFIVLLTAFVLESAVILISFGILRPQTNLFVFAAVFSLMAAVFNLLQSCFLGIAMGVKK